MMEDLTPVLTHSCSQLSGSHHTPCLAPPLCKLIKKMPRSFSPESKVQTVNPAPILPLHYRKPPKPVSLLCSLNPSWTVCTSLSPESLMVWVRSSPRPSCCRWAFISLNIRTKFWGRSSSHLCEVITTSGTAFSISQTRKRWPERWSCL